MTALRFKQSPADFRKVLQPWDRRTHRPHNRHIHGPIQGMNEDKSGKWFVAFGLVVAGYFLFRLIGG